jgi:isoleucyl-tRNA synthetase
MKTLGKKFGAQLQEAVASITSAPVVEVVAKVQKGEPFTLGEFSLDPSDVLVSYSADDGWAGATESGTQVAICTRITEALAGEGRAREVIRHVQDLRKQACLEMEDRIVLYLATEWEPLRQAIEALRDYIAGETLTVRWATAPLGQGAARAVVKVEGKELVIELMKAAQG